ncbi:MAG: dapb3 2 [Gemmatimonadetes bacterium]|nr:dapb3 2 [Gemmatimonadota bacterium]
MRILRSLALVALVATPLAAQKRAMTFEDFSAIRGVSDPQLSPDGRQVLYAVRTTDIAANKRTTVTYMVPVSGGAPSRFPSGAVAASEARWSPDGRHVAYVAGGQLWVAEADGGSARQLSQLNGGASGPVWAPTSDRVAFVSGAWPDCTTDACNVTKDSVKSASKVKAHVSDELMYRHWNAWDEGTRSHLFTVAIAGGAPRDITQGARYDVPPGPFGGSEGYSWSNDGRALAYTAKDQGRADAWTTDLNVYTVSADGGAAQVITASNKGADQNPVYSPDGRWIFYASQRRAGFESDRWRLMAYDRTSGRSRELLPAWDRNADAYSVTRTGDAIYVQGVDAGRTKFYRVAFDAKTGVAMAPKLVVGERNNAGLSLSADGSSAVWARDAIDAPGEVWLATLTNGMVSTQRALTHENDALVAQLDLHPAEDYWFTGASGARLQGFVVKPPNFDPSRKTPVVLLIHGGPQGEWLDNWGGRWSFQMYASTGVAVVAINPRGSIGYGQKLVDEVSKDWGGKAYKDLMMGLDTALARNKWMDRNATAAAGGSYGGYMVNWIAGHTKRFKALITHAGVFNLETMYGATEEIWFPEWEYGGPYWKNAQMEQQYRKWSPHLFAGNFTTPQLVIHGELDYRIPYSEGLSLFTALQKQNVPSRLLVFPDEGHWILKPQNAQLWWKEVQGWLGKYLFPKPLT